jgi:hypothetical protein
MYRIVEEMMDRMKLMTRTTKSTARTPRCNMTAIRRTIVVSMFTLAMMVQHLVASAALAAPLAQDPTGGINAKIEQVTTSLATLGRPLAGFAVVLGLIMYLLEPVLPEWTRENRGVIGKSIICAVAIGIAPDLISFFVGTA